MTIADRYTAPLFPDVDVTEVRTALIAESYQHHTALTRLAASGRAAGGLTKTECDLVEAHIAAAQYTYLLAGVLRIVENKHGAGEAREMAALFDAVRDVGT